MPWVISSDGKEILYKKKGICPFSRICFVIFKATFIYIYMYFIDYQAVINVKCRVVHFFNLEKLKHILRAFNQSFG